MKKIKLNIALLIAILVVGVTFTAQANIFGKRGIIRCFTQISLKNANGTQTVTIDATIITPPPCNTVKNQVVITQYVTAAVIATSLPDGSSCELTIFVCCIKVTEIPSTSPEYANAPFIDLGEGLKKYKINSASDVYCKE